MTRWRTLPSLSQSRLSGNSNRGIAIATTRKNAAAMSQARAAPPPGQLPTGNEGQHGRDQETKRSVGRRLLPHLRALISGIHRFVLQSRFGVAWDRAGCPIQFSPYPHKHVLPARQSDGGAGYIGQLLRTERSCRWLQGPAQVRTQVPASLAIHGGMSASLSDCNHLMFNY